MKFLNKKEQVIDLEITPYGKSLLARGRFKPEFYAFFDDEILYDSRYGGITEVQNSASVRINEMPQLETQAYYYSAEKQVKEATEFLRLTAEEKAKARALGKEPTDVNGKPYVADDGVTIGTIPDRKFSAQPLGKSKLNSSKAPAWDIVALKGEISSSVPYLSGSGKILRIPQLNMKEIVYTLKLSDMIESDNYYVFSGPNTLDGKVLSVLDDSIILEIDEDNTEFDWENFDVEVYELETMEYSGSNGITRTREFMRPLMFKYTPSLIKNGILLDPSEIQEQDIAVNPNYVEYYFDINVDKEIDQTEMCNLKPGDKAQGIFSSRTLECENLVDQETIDIEDLYDTEEFDGDCQ